MENPGMLDLCKISTPLQATWVFGSRNTGVYIHNAANLYMLPHTSSMLPCLWQVIVVVKHQNKHSYVQYTHMHILAIAQ